MKIETLVQLMCEAYLAGFDAAREGANGEHCYQKDYERIVKSAPEKVADLIANAINAGKL